MWKPFLEKFLLPNSKIGISINSWNNQIAYTYDEFQKLELPLDKGISAYFTPAQLKLDSPNGKADKSRVLGSAFAWSDADEITMWEEYQGILPPTFVVKSGYGFHLYWKLDEPCYDLFKLEQMNKILMNSYVGSGKKEFNADRVLRVPGSLNSKIEGDRKPVTLLINEQSRVYSYKEILALAKLDEDVASTIVTGDSEGFASRSERDWWVVLELMKTGFSRETCRLIFDYYPVGEKIREANGEHYWNQTIEKASKEGHHKSNGKASDDSETDELPVANAKKPKKKKNKDFTMNGNGIWRGDRRITTFTMKPVQIMKGELFATQDSMTFELNANGQVVKVVMPKAAFNSKNAFNTYLLGAQFSFLGSDLDVNYLLPYLIENEAIPEIVGVPQTGLYKVNEAWYYAADNATLGCEGLTKDVKWVPNRNEHPEVILKLEPDDKLEDKLNRLARYLPDVNVPEVSWPAIGWYFATPVKEWLATKNYPFPIANITGTRGSGKTSLIKLMQRVLGYAPKIFDGKTTSYVILNLLSSTNAVPVSLSEFREASVDALVRYILLSYDRSKAARGQANQTTKEYPMLAPMTIDGEDLVGDSAAQQRAVVWQLTPNTVNGDSSYKDAYKTLVKDVPNIGTEYFAFLLKELTEGSLSGILQEAERDFDEQYPDIIADRIRNNHIVVLFGMYLFAKFVCCDRPSASTLSLSLESIKDRVLVDELIEQVVSEISQGRRYYPAEYDKDSNVVYFQLNTWHGWWLKNRRSQGRGTFELHAIQKQLMEHKAYAGIGIKQKIAMVGIDLAKAYQLGVQVPEEFEEHVRIQL